MTPLVILRPQPAAARTATLARDMGFDAHPYPLFELHGRDWEAPAAGVDAVLLSSANALRFGGDELAKIVHLPAYVVGDRTAQQARAAGFNVVAQAADGIASLVRNIDPDHASILRLAGADHIAVAPPEGVAIRTAILYESRPLPMPEDLAELLCGPSTALLHSARAAEHFAHLCTAMGLARMNIALACLSPRIAEAAGRGWRAVAVTDETSDAALLETARALCQSFA